MATAATTLATDPLHTWIAGLPDDVGDVSIERVALDSGRQGGSRTPVDSVTPDRLERRLRRLATGRYRLSAYGPHGIVAGGVRVVEVVAGVVSVASPRTTRKARVRSRHRRTQRVPGEAREAHALVATLTQQVAQLSQIVAAQGASIAELTTLVRRSLHRKKKRASTQVPSPASPAPSTSAPPLPPRAPGAFTPRLIDLGGIAFAQPRVVIANPAAPPTPRAGAPVRTQTSALEAFLRQTPAPHASNDVPGPTATAPWLDFTEVLRFLGAMGVVPGVTRRTAARATAPKFM